MWLSKPGCGISNLRLQPSTAFLLYLLVALLVSSSAEDDPCTSKTTCGECLRSPDCAWCAKADFKGGDNMTIFRCNNFLRYNNPEGTHNCGENDLIHTTSKLVFSDNALNPNTTPSRIQLQLRLGQSVSVPISYSETKGYPIDLYYLMDLTDTMRASKTQLSELGNQLADSMRSLTSNFRLGFGSFVDKITMPYSSTYELSREHNLHMTVPSKISLASKNARLGIDARLQTPCKGCVPPYPFRNHMSLNEDTSSFTVEVSNAPISGNLDDPEGGLDALVQAIVCEDQIGWRNGSRRVIVFATDGAFHFAGDGKLGGIVIPNDEKCHLDTTGLYTHSILQDYPSVAQLNRVAKEKSANIIFAITENQKEPYEKLVNRIEGAVLSTLSNNSANIIELVKNQYEIIASTIELRDTASRDITVSYFSKCSGDVETETKKCTGLELDKPVEFTIKVTATQCPTDSRVWGRNGGVWKQKFYIYRVGIDKPTEVEVEVMCDCPCNTQSNGAESPSDACSNNGYLKCGICQCKSGFRGSACECSLDDGLSVSDDEAACRKNNTIETCSNQGKCVCGQCHCNLRDDPSEVISGAFCECDNYSCPRNTENILCSGNGVCDCGECKCKDGWTGENCDCSTDKTSCIEPGSSVECGGHGRCECGKCICDEDRVEGYRGKYCEPCAACKDRCDEFLGVVKREIFQSKSLENNLTETCTAATDRQEVELVDEILPAGNQKDCSFVNSSCKYFYAYGYEKTNFYVKARSTPECPRPIPILPIMLGVIGMVVLIGIVLLLVWKICTELHYRFEYARFTNDQKSEKWQTNQNPLYKPATTTVTNPLYMSSSKE